jgi:hypothetical protein
LIQRREGSMAKRIKPRKEKFSLTRQMMRPKVAAAAAIALIAALAAGTVVGPWRNTVAANKLRAFVTSPFVPPPLPSPSNPSKEYIYAGSKLIATEVPTTLLAPTALIATTLSNLPVAQVNTSWTATAGAHHYEVERTTNIAANYTTVNSNVTATNFTDTTVSSVVAYLYRVRAVDSSGNVSPYSNVDLATAISFVDDTLQAGATTIKADHITQLRQAVNAVRAITTSLGQVSWAESITPGVSIKASHIQELRTKLDDARSALGFGPCAYTDASIGQLIQKVHIDQLRQCVK